jgi:hypothetical protein
MKISPVTLSVPIEAEKRNRHYTWGSNFPNIETRPFFPKNKGPINFERLERPQN